MPVGSGKTIPFLIGGTNMRVRRIAEGTLSAFVAHLESQEVDVPERRYVAAGQGIPWDGEQLVVVLMGIGQGGPGRPMGQAYRSGSELFMAQFAVAITREVHALGQEGPLTALIPDEAELNEDGLQAMVDAEALVKAAVAIHAANSITEGGVDFEIGECSPVGPEGGLAGVRQLLNVNL